MDNLTEDDLKRIFFEDHEDFEMHDDSADWVQDYKYQHTEVIVKHLPTGKFYALAVGRSGSYHTDWEYMFHSPLVEVEKHTKTVVTEVWLPVKNGE